MAEPNRVNRTPEQRVPGGQPKFPGIIIAIAIVVLVLIVIWIAKQPRIAANPNGPRQQVSKRVEFNNLEVTSQGGAFDIQGQAVNKGDKPITKMTVEVDFKNLMGSTLESPEAEVANADGTDFHSNPLPPNQPRPVQIKMTHAPAGWDQKPPELKVKSVEWGESQAQPAGSSEAPNRTSGR